MISKNKIKLQDAIEEIPEEDWISCDKQLPEKNGSYWCSVYAAQNPIRILEFKPDDSFICPKNQRLWIDGDSYVFNWFVAAWLPRPDDYK